MEVEEEEAVPIGGTNHPSSSSFSSTSTDEHNNNNTTKLLHEMFENNNNNNHNNNEVEMDEEWITKLVPFLKRKVSKSGLFELLRTTKEELEEEIQTTRDNNVAAGKDVNQDIAEIILKRVLIHPSLEEMASSVQWSNDELISSFCLYDKCLMLFVSWLKEQICIRVYGSEEIARQLRKNGTDLYVFNGDESKTIYESIPLPFIGGPRQELIQQVKSMATSSKTPPNPSLITTTDVFPIMDDDMPSSHAPEASRVSSSSSLSSSSSSTMINTSSGTSDGFRTGVSCASLLLQLLCANTHLLDVTNADLRNLHFYARKFCSAMDMVSPYVKSTDETNHYSATTSSMMEQQQQQQGRQGGRKKRKLNNENGVVLEGSLSFEGHVKVLELIETQMVVNDRGNRDWIALERVACTFPECRIKYLKQKAKRILQERRTRKQLRFWDLLKRYSNDLALIREDLMKMLIYGTNPNPGANNNNMGSAIEGTRESNMGPPVSSSICGVTLLSEDDRNIIRSTFDDEFVTKLGMHCMNLLSASKTSPGNLLEWEPNMRSMILERIVALHKTVYHGKPLHRVHTNHFSNLFSVADIEQGIMYACDCPTCKDIWQVDEIADRESINQVRLHWSRHKAQQIRAILEMHRDPSLLKLDGTQHKKLRHWTRQDFESVLSNVHTMEDCCICSNKTMTVS